MGKIFRKQKGMCLVTELWDLHGMWWGYIQAWYAIIPRGYLVQRYGCGWRDNTYSWHQWAFLVARDRRTTAAPSLSQYPLGGAHQINFALSSQTATRRELESFSCSKTKTFAEVSDICLDFWLCTYWGQGIAGMAEVTGVNPAHKQPASAAPVTYWKGLKERY